MSDPDPIVTLLDKWVDRIRAARRLVSALTVFAVTAATPITIFTPLSPVNKLPTLVCELADSLPADACD